MSPEQGRGRTVDARSDIYALGIVTYELFTGHVPFRADTPVATLLMHVEADPPLDDPALPRPIAEVLRRALAKDPRDRFANAAAMASALRATSGTRPIRRREGTSPQLAVAAVLAAAAVLGWMLWDRTAHEPPVSPSPPASTGPSSTPPAPAESPVQPLMLPTAAPDPAVSSRPPRAIALATPTPIAPTEATPEPSPDLPAATAPAVAIAPSPSAPPPTTAPAATGLVLAVQPWADVSIDGIPRGQTPLARLELAPGPHQVVLSHPDYQPWVRRIRVDAGETLRLRVDLRTDGIRRR
jgi:serine/threonine-protein kinase